MAQSLPILSARIKLRARHLSEWHTLATNQQKVWQLVCEETANKPSSYSDANWAAIELIRRQTKRLNEIMVRQREEREHMKARHRQEKTLLEQVSETPEKKSN